MVKKQAIGKKGQNFRHTFCLKGQYSIIFRTNPKLNFALPFPQLAYVVFVLLFDCDFLRRLLLEL